MPRRAAVRASRGIARYAGTCTPFAPRWQRQPRDNLSALSSMALSAESVDIRVEMSNVIASNVLMKRVGALAQLLCTSMCIIGGKYEGSASAAARGMAYRHDATPRLAAQQHAHASRQQYQHDNLISSPPRHRYVAKPTGRSQNVRHQRNDVTRGRAYLRTSTRRTALGDKHRNAA